MQHPKDLQDGLVEVNEDDCLANVPYVEGCGLWFDHHSSEPFGDTACMASLNSGNPSTQKNSTSFHPPGLCQGGSQ